MYLCVLFSYRLLLKFALFWEHFIHFSELGRLLKVISEEKTVSEPWSLTLGNVMAKTQCARQNWGCSYPDKSSWSKWWLNRKDRRKHWTWNPCGWCIVMSILKTHVSDNYCPLSSNDKMELYRFNFPASVDKFDEKKKSHFCDCRAVNRSLNGYIAWENMYFFKIFCLIHSWE